jgi:glycosyltransferase involved in cell wall biosynthesis
VHGSYLYLSSQNKKLLQYIFKKSDKVLFVNQYLYEVLPDDLKEIIVDKYQVVLNGVDTKFKYEKIDIYKKYNLNLEDIIVFHPARFVKEKNHLKVIEAFKSVSMQNVKVKLVLAGDGILKKEIENKIEDLDLKEQVILLGLIEKNDVYNFLEKSEVFIMPSISEGLNIAFLEAMCMKIKILVSDIEQFTYPFNHYGLNPSNFNVSFANPDNIDEISKALSLSLDSLKKEKFDMSIFSLDTMIKEYKNIYTELIK